MKIMSEKAPGYRLTLYIAGETATGETAVSNLKKIESAFGEEIDIRVVDVASSPDSAHEAGVSISPTLVREFPLPQRKLIGDLSDPESVIRFLKKN